MSYLINKEEEELLEGIWFISSKYPYYNPETMYDSKKKEYYSLEMIINSIKEHEGIREEILKIMIFDFLIGNTDRHQNNWAIIKCGDDYKISPLYDNGSSLCCYLEEKKLSSYLGNDEMKFNSLVNTKSKSRVRLNKEIKKETTHLEMIKYISDNYYDEVINLIYKINNELSDDVINNIILEYDDDLLSAERKSLIIKFLKEKIKLMNQVFLRKEG